MPKLKTIDNLSESLIFLKIETPDIPYTLCNLSSFLTTLDVSIIAKKDTLNQIIFPDKLEKLFLPNSYDHEISLPQTLKFVKLPSKYSKDIPRHCKIVILT